MIEKKITAANASDEIRKLYEEAFPEEERIPWTDLLRLTLQMPLDFTAYYDGDTFVGMTIVYLRKSFNWFWYFAVEQNLRGKGYGRQILTRLIEKYKDSANILDMESPEQLCDNLEQRKRRYGFYLRAGFRDTHVCRTFEGITYTILMIGDGIFTEQNYDEIIDELKRFWWRKDGSASISLNRTFT